MRRGSGLGWSAIGLCAVLSCTINPAVPFIPPDTAVMFRDDFSSSALGAGWTFAGADPSLVRPGERSGYLRILPAPIGTPASDVSRVLRDATGDFILVTRMAFEPGADRQFSGLVVEGEDGRTVTLGILEASFPRGVFRGLSAVAERAGGGDAETAFEPFDEAEVFLRLERLGGQFNVSYSRDGVSFFRFANLTVTLSDEVRVGVGTIIRDTCERRCDEPAPADFDFFEIRAGE